MSTEYPVASTEIAGQHAYAAFIDSLNEFLPPIVQTWSEMHPRVRAAWMKAAAAAIELEASS